MDFDFLRKEAIEVSQKASGKKWTDYNIHDPGVTILEQFSFVLTDIAYRTNIGIEELLFHNGNPNVVKSNALLPARDIFTPAPVTITDYRILILDNFVQTISNCWLEKVANHREGISGLFNLVVHVNPQVPPSDLPELRKSIRSFYNEHRNLGEDLEEITFLEPLTIDLEAKVEVAHDTAAEDVVAQVLFQIENYFNPVVDIKGLEELKDEGKALDEIYDIPSHRHGFISRESLGIKDNQFYLSKIEEIISSIKGVRMIKELKIYQDGALIQGDLISVDGLKYLTMLNASGGDDAQYHFDISVYKGGVVNNYGRDSVVRRLLELQHRFIRTYSLEPRENGVKETALSAEDIRSYNSVQESFPSVYGLHVYTPAKEQGVLRQAQSAQLKAYLMMFDQLMANHLAQLSKIAELMSIGDFDPKEFRTYHTQSLNEIVEGGEDLVKKKLRSLIDIEKELQHISSKRSSSKGSTSETKEQLERELSQKRQLVADLTEMHLERFQEMTKAEIQKDRSFENREIHKATLSWLAVSTSAPKSKKAQSTKLLAALRTLIEAELYRQEQLINFEQEDLDALALGFDDRLDRKNRVLSHMLARFGESFKTDFYLSSSKLSDHQSTDMADMRILELKSSLLQNIVNVNRNRGIGIGFGPDAINRKTSLEERVGVLLDIQGGLQRTSDKSLNALKADRLTATQTKREKSPSGQLEYITTKGRKKSSQIRFIVNSPHFMKYLFQFGMARANYQIVSESDEHTVYFIPPTHEDATKLFTVKTMREAEDKIDGLLTKLSEISAENEHFKIVEHVLLRPQDSSFCDFYLNNAKGDKVFKSHRIGREDVQMASAIDTMILGGYIENFEIQKTKDKDFSVVIQNTEGSEMARSTKAFLTELSAEKFVKSVSSHYQKQKGSFKELIELDNKTHFYFQFIDESENALFTSNYAEEIETQEQRIKRYLDLGASSENYEVLEDKKSHLLRVRLRNVVDEGYIQSVDHFRSERDANSFIVSSIEKFKQWDSSEGNKKYVRYKRIDGRDARDFNALLSVVYPNWTSRFSDEEFLELFHETLIEYTPAHLSLRLVGLNYTEMEEFSDLYDSLTTELKEISFDNRNKISSLSNEILNLIIKD